MWVEWEGAVDLNPRSKSQQLLVLPGTSWPRAHHRHWGDAELGLEQLRNPARGSWEPLSTSPCTLGMGSMASEGPIKPQQFLNSLIHPGACPRQQILCLPLH